MSYTSRVHMKRALLGVDYKFIASVLALIAAIVLAIRYLG